ncbi:hypothetical protein SAMN05421753_111139 [Planctomicrobium piriforme]|uniref:Uncharacterized protein n=1 Tax=Planctomicrobium piriforme TaxID=1576369 RepID=A0A1I3K775_9PLAN|nr:hypothetical protein SAMN05421753_111139 [Planctomicrobium piriforme]
MQLHLFNVGVFLPRRRISGQQLSLLSLTVLRTFLFTLRNCSLFQSLLCSVIRSSGTACVVSPVSDTTN